MNKSEERRLRFLEEDKEMFGLVPTEEEELKKLREENYQCSLSSKVVGFQEIQDKAHLLLKVSDVQEKVKEFKEETKLKNLIDTKDLSQKEIILFGWLLVEVQLKLDKIFGERFK